MNITLPVISKDLLKLTIAERREIPGDIQHTRERRPDFLNIVGDLKGNQYILHIEYQTTNDKDVAYRMAEYYIMLQRKYRLPVKQFVLYLGKGKANMPHKITTNNFRFSYGILSLSDINYRLFLKNNNPEVIILGILGTFGTLNADLALKKIISKLRSVKIEGLALERYMMQLKVLSQLRNLETQFDQIMESVSTFWKEERDPHYIRGKRKGEQEGRIKGEKKGIKIGRSEVVTEIIKNLILNSDFNNQKIAGLTKTDEGLVNNLRTQLQNS